MKRCLAVLTAVLVAASLPAMAATTVAKPKKVTFHLHGEASGEVEYAQGLSDGLYPFMDTQAPSAPAPSSKQIANGVITPNYKCAGNRLFPAWVGRLEGRVVGDVRLQLHTVSSPGQVDVRIWPDVTTQMCDSTVGGSSSYPKPAAEIRVDLPTGHGEVDAVLKDVDFVAKGFVMVQVSPAWTTQSGEWSYPPFVARALYDSPSFDSTLQLTCIPLRGRSCV